ncbi:8-oxo-dGTP diphosphatase [Pelagirhabdus alkalitolerans]|uniref:8-oxo-dGTP diphosphatase n=1 Tax=Pelagirhabdus alkalitolerans TaxID=1612202 RepID=A0A1G6LV65_9BACI|nr:nucleoside triphosphatase YtkD [Pelagirhabdus alkalitolerans]SDC47198.1 8-oxo-dGTP diphosphatase [Pelagirhabdus alkalitolerans]
MYVFKDYYQNEVMLSFEVDPFSSHPKHVFVICRYHGKWLLTRHKTRGLEFPGGKVEKNESPEEAALREVYEETGGLVNQLRYLGQYYVDGKGKKVIKNIYVADIDRLDDVNTYYETHGPVIIEKLPSNLKQSKTYSFIMKDDMIRHSLNQLRT